MFPPSPKTPCATGGVPLGHSLLNIYTHIYILSGVYANGFIRKATFPSLKVKSVIAAVGVRTRPGLYLYLGKTPPPRIAENPVFFLKIAPRGKHI